MRWPGCHVERTPAAGVYGFSAAAYAELDCSEPGCDDCEPNEDGYCQLTLDEARGDEPPLSAEASLAYPEDTELVLTFEP